jgi:hypothetical protein
MKILATSPGTPTTGLNASQNDLTQAPGTQRGLRR